MLTGRIKPGEPLQTEALGLVFLTAGLAIWLEVSYLLAGMTAGMLIVNFARHHRQAFHEIENARWPFMVLFFLLAGVSLELDHLATMGSSAGLSGAAYRSADCRRLDPVRGLAGKARWNVRGSASPFCRKLAWRSAWRWSRRKLSRLGRHDHHADHRHHGRIRASGPARHAVRAAPRCRERKRPAPRKGALIPPLR